MGLPPARENENQRCRARESGDPSSCQGIPAYAGMTWGVIFEEPQATRNLTVR